MDEATKANLELDVELFKAEDVEDEVIGYLEFIHWGAGESEVGSDFNICITSSELEILIEKLVATKDLMAKVNSGELPDGFKTTL